MKKKIKIIFYVLLYIILLLAISYKMYKNNKKVKIVEITAEEYMKYIENTPNEKVFPEVDISKKTATEETKKLIKKHFANFYYNKNTNKNVAFKMLMPIYLNNKMNIGSEDPFKLTNENYAVLGELDDQQTGISARIYAFNTNLEVEPSVINKLFLINNFKHIPIKINYDYYIEGTRTDLLTHNPQDNKITRSIVIRHSSLYYIIMFTFKNFYYYMQHAREVSMIFKSFEPKIFSNKLVNIDFDLAKIGNYDLLYPKDWKFNYSYIEEEKLNKINIKKDNGSVFYDIDLYENNKKSLRELQDEYLEIIKKRGFLFDGIDEKRSNNNKQYNNFIVLYLKNARTKDNIPITICIKIEMNKYKRMITIMYSSRTEEKSYIYYHQDERILQVIIHSLVLGFFNDKKIENTNWINLYYKYNNKINNN